MPVPCKKSARKIHITSIHTCTTHMLFLSGTRTRLTPSFYGSMARLPRFRSDLLRQPPIADHFVLSSSLCPPSSFPPAYDTSPRLVRLFVPSFVRVTHPDAAFRRLQCATASLFLSLYLTLFHSSLFPSVSVSFHPSVPAPTASGYPRAPLFSAARPFLVPNPARFHG